LSSRILALRPAAINLVATRKPLEILQQLRIPRLPPVISPVDPALAEWARLAALPNLWFVRRRNLAYRDDLAGEAIRLSPVATHSTGRHRGSRRWGSRRPQSGCSSGRRRAPRWKSKACWRARASPNRQH
jgi:hypothetical protein